MSDLTSSWITYAILGAVALLVMASVKRWPAKLFWGAVAFALLLWAALTAFTDPVFWIVIVIAAAIAVLIWYLKRRKAHRDHEREDEERQRGPQIHIHNHH